MKSEVPFPNRESLQSIVAPDRSGRWSKAKAVVAAGAAGAAALTVMLWPSQTDAKSSSPSLRDVQQATDNFEVIAGMSSHDKSELEAAIEGIPRAAVDNPMLVKALTTAADFAVSSEILGYSSYVSPEDKLPASRISDPVLRHNVEVAVYTLSVEPLKNTIAHGSSETALESAKATLQQTMPVGAESVAEHAQQELDRGYAAKLVRSATTPRGIQQAKVELTKIADPEVRAQVERVFQTRAAADLLSDFYLKTTTQEKALEEAGKISDPALRAQVETAIHAPKEHGYATVANRISTTLELDAYKIVDTMTQGKGSPFGADKEAADDLKLDVTTKRYKTLNAAEAEFGRVLSAKFNIADPTESLTALEILPNPNDLINLDAISHTLEVPNIGKDEKDKKAPTAFDQFGEIIVENGRLKLTFEGAEVTGHLQEQLQAVINNNAPLIEAAFERGSLSSFRFVLGESFDPYYSSASREVIMMLSVDDPLTVNQLDAVTTHEVTHSIFRDYFRGIEVDAAERQQLAEACLAIKTTTYEDIELQLFYQPHLLNDLRSQVKPEHVAVVDTIIKAVSERNVDTALITDSTDFESTIFNTCRYTGDPYGLVLDAARETEKNSTKYGELRYITETPAYREFAATIEGLLEYGSIFASINESEYVDTPTITEYYLGHGEDNANELYASVFDAAINFPDEFQKNLNKLDSEKQSALKQALASLINAGRERAPMLEVLFNQLEDRYLK